MNLISNAIKFTEHGQVAMSASVGKTEGRCVIIKFKVKDTGIGIPSDKTDVIFERFSRLTPSYSGVYPGKGYSLYIVNRFLADISGEIHVDSQLEQGTVFTILIPYTLPLLSCAEEAL